MIYQYYTVILQNQVDDYNSGGLRHTELAALNSNWERNGIAQNTRSDGLVINLEHLTEDLWKQYQGYGREYNDRTPDSVFEEAFEWYARTFEIKQRLFSQQRPKFLGATLPNWFCRKVFKPKIAVIQDVEIKDNDMLDVVDKDLKKLGYTRFPTSGDLRDKLKRRGISPKQFFLSGLSLRDQYEILLK